MRTIGSLLDLSAAAVPGHVAVSLGDECRTFAHCDRNANRLANRLLALGLRRGDRLLFWSAISLDSFDLFFATQRIGVAFVPLNPAFSAEEAQPFVAYIRPRLVVTDAGRFEPARSIAGDVPTVSMADLARQSERASDNAPSAGLVGEEDIHAIFLTSGSTGVPKGVMVSHRASWHRAYFGNSRAPTSGGGGEVNMFPLFHWAGWHFSLCAWSQRRAIHLTPAADADALNAIIARWQPAWMYAIPAVWQRLLDSADFGTVRSLRHLMTGTYRVEPALVAALRERLPGIDLTIGWGATELGVGLQIGDEDIDRKPYSVGLPAPGVEVKLINGELAGRSHQLMSGYFDLPEETDRVLRDGWYLSGDVAEQDDEGFFTITGRTREIIRTGGETVAPSEVEAALRLVPGVADACVIGLPDARWGEIICAVLVMQPGQEIPDIETLRNALAGQLAAFKHPRRVIAAATLPRTAATGQIQRSLVRDKLLAQM